MHFLNAYFHQLGKMNKYAKIKEGIPSTITVPPELEKLCDWVEKNGYPISGSFELYSGDIKIIEHWFGHGKVLNRFGVFGTGPDDSLYSFWLDKNNNQKIVHLGSEGGQLYILAANFVDFLRLLAIGYDEIGFSDLTMSLEEWNKTIEESEDYGKNPKFRNWVEREFQTIIPERGDEISSFQDKSFEAWVGKQLKYTRI